VCVLEYRSVGTSRRWAASVGWLGRLIDWSRIGCVTSAPSSSVMTTARPWAADQGPSDPIFPDSIDPTTGNCSDAAAEAAWNAHLDSQLYPARAVDRAVTPVWYAVGIVGNVLSATIWLQRRMLRNNSSAVYLATLSINDTLFLLLHILLDLGQAWHVQTLDYPVICESFSFIFLVTQYLAPTLVLGFTVERFIAVCYPYQVPYVRCPLIVDVSSYLRQGCTLLSERSLQASRRYCNESGRHFRIYLFENWTDLDKTWHRDNEWGSVIL